MEVTFAYLIHHILQGHCIGESQLVEPIFFIDDLFVTYGTIDGVMMMEGKCSGQMSSLSYDVTVHTTRTPPVLW